MTRNEALINSDIDLSQMSYLDELKKNWDGFAENDPFWAILAEDGRNKNRWLAEEFFQTGRDEIDSIIKYIDSINLNETFPKGTALDFGCGAGRLTQPLAEHFNEVCGVDISSNFIRLAKKYNNYPGKCKYYLNKKDDLTIFENNKFNFIYSNIVLQHMKPVCSKRYIAEFMRVLAPGGLLIFQMPSENITLWGKILWKILIPLRYFLTRQPTMEMNCIPRTEVIDHLGKHGGIIIDVAQDEWAGKYFKSFRYCVTK